jgi:predicted cobalt transporter CbtA
VDSSGTSAKILGFLAKIQSKNNLKTCGCDDMKDEEEEEEVEAMDEEVPLPAAAVAEVNDDDNCWGSGGGWGGEERIAPETTDM